MTWEVIHGDCLDAMAGMPDASIDAVVTDPPYGIGFMGKEWDGAAIVEAARRDRERRRSLGPASPSRPGRAEPRSSSAFGNEAIIAGPVRGGHEFQAWCEAWAREALRVLKPGGHALVFGGTRTYHRLTCGLEDAGFEIRDCLVWLYGSGFPKSLDVSKAIDKAAGAERKTTGRAMGAANDGVFIGDATTKDGGGDVRWNFRPEYDATTPATPDAERWQGWGTALKPAHEPIVVARKPLAGTVAANVLEHGTGALNIDGCRIGTTRGAPASHSKTPNQIYGELPPEGRNPDELDPNVGRWPANVVLDEEAAAMLDEQSGERPGGGSIRNGYHGGDAIREREPMGDTGGASRFFYCAKASSAERNAGLEHMPAKFAATMGDGIGVHEHSPADPRAHRANVHPTVKPIDLMRWLVRLVTPPDGTVLDPFTGSGTTGIATVLESFDFIGIEREAEYVDISRARLAHWEPQGWQLGLGAA